MQKDFGSVVVAIVATTPGKSTTSIQALQDSSSQKCEPAFFTCEMARPEDRVGGLAGVSADPTAEFDSTTNNCGQQGGTLGHVKVSSVDSLIHMWGNCGTRWLSCGG